MKKPLLFLIALLLCASVASPATYYVSKMAGSSDSKTGTSWANAWNTLAPVNNVSKFGKGDTVFFGAGVWRAPSTSLQYTIIANPGQSSTDKTCYADSLYWNSSTGKASNAWPGHRVAWIYGSDSLSGWTQDSGNRYRCTYTANAQVYNGFLCIFQGDSILWGQTSAANVNSAGKYYYNGTTVYLWAYGGGNPSQYDIETSVRPAVMMGEKFARWGGYSSDSTDGPNNVTLLGLGFKYGVVGMGFYSTYGYTHCEYSNFLIEHCYLSNVAGWGGINPSLIYTGLVDDNARRCTYHRVKACSLGTVWAFSGNSGEAPVYPCSEDRSHGNCLTWYSNWYSVIDSCVTFGHQSEAAIYLKFNPGSSLNSVQDNYQDTIRFNILNADSIPGSDSDANLKCTPYGIRLFGETIQAAIFGNVITYFREGIVVDYSAYQTTSLATNHIIKNNTFYNCRHALNEGPIESNSSGHSSTGNRFKWNIVYNSAATTFVGLSVDPFSLYRTSEWTQIDSNMYYCAASTINSFNGGTWSAWKGTFDIHASTNTVNPGFDSAGTRKWSGFRRSSASQQMSQVIAGDTFTVYGGVQPLKQQQQSLPPVAPTLSSIDSVHNDYINEIDSVRVNIQTTSQQVTGIIKVCWSNSVYPDSNGSDSLVKTYVASSTISFDIIQSMTEDAWLYVSAWVRDSAGQWSSRITGSRFFNKIVPPIAALSVDSIHCDAPGELDTIRVNFTTQNLPGADSVGFAIGTSSGLTTASINNWVKPYTQNSSASFLWTLSMIETATVYVRAWAFSGAATAEYSSPLTNSRTFTATPVSFVAKPFRGWCK